ncbi:MAG: MFS transporter [Candidatus Solibacter sp.]|jgi:ACS family hexuronate transporter-like MFS transporter
MPGPDRKAAETAVEAPGTPAGGFRWTICALLFFATTVNYADRQILGILAPTLQREIGWSEAQYGLIVTAFQGAYAIGLLGMGRFIDRVGTRLGYSLALGWWSIAAMMHALAASAMGFGCARFLLGLGEAGNFPAAIKTVAEWFPKRERALATGVFNSGSNAGAILAPLLVPWLTLEFGWRWAFASVGGAGLLWIVAWLLIYREPAHHPRLSRAELDYISSEPAESVEHVPWRVLIANRPVWGLLLARFLTDPVWWFYLYWVPKFLNSQFGLKLDQIGLPVAGMYLASSAGGIFGGWLYSFLTEHGRGNNAARKLAMLACALMVLPIVLAPRVSNPWLATGLISLAMAGHCGWAANIFTIVSDIFPKRAVSSVTGICGFGGATGGMLVSSAVGFVLQATGSYLTIFALASFSYLVGLSIIHLMSPRLLAVNLEVRNT